MKTKTLFFIVGASTQAQRDLADEAGAVIRNASAVHDGDYLEQCDAVMGAIPKQYAEAEKHKLHSKAEKICRVEVKAAAKAAPETKAKA